MDALNPHLDAEDTFSQFLENPLSNRTPTPWVVYTCYFQRFHWNLGQLCPTAIQEEKMSIFTHSVFLLFSKGNK